MSADSERVSVRSLLSYAAPCIPLAAVGLPLVVYLPPFYANTVGLPLSLVGIAFMGARIGDVVFDPLLGGWMDATRTRFGRYRAWMLLSLPILMLGVGLLFFPPKGAGFAWFLSGLFLTYLGYAFAILSQGAWGAVLSNAYHQRSRVAGYWQAGNIIGLIIAVSLPVLATVIGLKGPGAGIAAMGAFILITYPIGVAIISLGSPEPLPKHRHAPRPVLHTLKEVFRLFIQPTVGRVMALDFLLAFAPGVTGALFQFFFHQAKGYSTLEANGLLMAYFAGAIFGAPLFTRLARALGKHWALAIAALYYALFQALILLSPKLPILEADVTLFIAGFGYAGPLLLLRAMTADLADEAQLKTGRNETGLLMGMLNSINKVGYALAVGLAFPFLAANGFHASDATANTPHALAALRFAFIFPAIIASVLGAVLLIGYPLNEARLKVIQGELAAREKEQHDQGPQSA